MLILIVKETDFILTCSVDGVAESYKKESISELHDDEFDYNKNHICFALLILVCVRHI